MDTIFFFDSTVVSRDTAGVLSRIAGEFVILNFLINFSRVFFFIALKFKWERSHFDSGKTGSFLTFGSEVEAALTIFFMTEWQETLNIVRK